MRETYIAGHVELRAAGLASGMQRNSLRPHKIITLGQIRRDRRLKLPAVLVQDVRPPRLARDVVPELCNLEEGVRAVGGRGVGDGGEVDHYGAEVVAADGGAVAVAVAGLLVHLDGDGVAGGYIADAGRGGGAGVAAEVVGVNGRDGAVAGLGGVVSDAAW